MVPTIVIVMVAPSKSRQTFNVHGRGSYSPKPISAGERRSVQDARARLAGSRLPPAGWRIEQVASPFLLRIVGVLDLQPPDARVIGIGKALCDDPFEVVGAHQLEQLSATAVDGNRLGGNGRRSVPFSHKTSKAT
jgi:hypothetical protein